MKVFVFLALVGVACANPQLILANSWPWGGAITYNTVAAQVPTAQVLTAAIPAPAPVAIAPVALPTAQKWHAQTELGEASWGYAHPGQAHAQTRDALGTVQGSYAYINPEGKEVKVLYTADSVNGFRVASNNLPIAPLPPPAPLLVGPAPVQDTPEVQKAKEEHLQAIQEAKTRNAEADKNDGAEEDKKDDDEEPKNEEEEAAPAEGESKRRRKRGAILAAPSWSLSAPTTIIRSAPVLAAPLTLAAPTVLSAAPVTATVLSAPAATVLSAPGTATVLSAPAVRQATLTKIHNNPGHAVSYRVD